MPDNRWTLEPEIDTYLENMEWLSDEFMQQLMAERAPIEAAAPQEGDAAPDFTAQKLLTEAGLTGEQYSLADHFAEQQENKGPRPLALLFGSLTCPVYRGQTERFNEIYNELHGRLDFLLVYIIEAHPEDGWQLPINHSQNCVYAQPTRIEERAAIAADCITSRGIAMPVVIDDMDDTVSTLYSGSPERLYLIDADGIVRHRSPTGPFKLAAIEAWYAALLAGI